MTNEMTPAERAFFPKMAEQLDRQAGEQKPASDQAHDANARPAEKPASEDRNEMTLAERAFFPKMAEEFDHQGEKPGALEQHKEGERPVEAAQHDYSGLKFDAASEGASDEERQATEQLQTSTRQLFGELGIAPDDGQALIDEFRTHQAEEPAQARVDAWEAESRSMLEREFGDQALAVLQDAARLLGRRPELQRALAESGWASNPRVVLAACRAAKAERARGKLR